MTKQEILTADEAREKISELMSESDETILLSAYFTEGAFSFLTQLDALTSPKLVIRARPMDFHSGASNISAIYGCLDCGWDIRFISALHAKAYLIADNLVIGSGNLTSNGLHLLGSGNLELNCLIDADDKSKKLIRNIFDQAQKFDLSVLAKMERYLTSQEQHGYDEKWWPEDVVKQVQRKLFCNDFPQFSADSNNTDDQHPWSDIRMFLLRGDNQKASELTESADAIKWLGSVIEGRDNGVRFGEITAKLHGDLAEDPAPYRREVKELLANLLSYVGACPNMGFLIERPSHTQVVKRITVSDH